MHSATPSKLILRSHELLSHGLLSLELLSDPLVAKRTTNEALRLHAKRAFHRVIKQCL